MLTSTVLKWAVPSAAAVLIATTGSAIAAKVTHKNLALTHKTPHALVKTTTPAGTAKAHALHTTTTHAKKLTAVKSTKAKTLAAKHTLASKSHKPVTVAHKSTSTLDKKARVVSNM